jgi:hypothetical protein
VGVVPVAQVRESWVVKVPLRTASVVAFTVLRVPCAVACLPFGS